MHPSHLTVLIIWLQAERQALRKDVTRAQTQLLEAQTSNRAAEAAASTSHEEKVAMAESLSLARFASKLPCCCAYTKSIAWQCKHTNVHCISI